MDRSLQWETWAFILVVHLLTGQTWRGCMALSASVFLYVKLGDWVIIWDPFCSNFAFQTALVEVVKDLESPPPKWIRKSWQAQSNWGFIIVILGDGQIKAEGFLVLFGSPAPYFSPGPRCHLAYAMLCSHWFPFQLWRSMTALKAGHARDSSFILQYTHWPPPPDGSKSLGGLALHSGDLFWLSPGAHMAIPYLVV